MSGRPGLLSRRQRLLQPALRPVQPQADRVRGQTHRQGDLPGRQLLPRPEPEHFLVGLGQRLEGPLQTAVVGGVLARPLPGEAVHQALLPSRAAEMVGQAPARDAVRPGQRALRWHVVQSAPEHEQDVAEHVVGPGRVGPAEQVTLHRRVDLGHQPLEAPAPLGVLSEVGS